MILRSFFILSGITLLLGGCDTWGDVSPGFTQMGYKPVYAKSSDLGELIKSSTPQNLTATGKIYTKGNYLLVTRPYEGVHVFDNTDPGKPVNLSFIQIPGNIDVAMKGDFLYADYIGRIVVLDLKDVMNPRITQTAKLDTAYQNFPPADLQRESWRTYYECPDPSKGTVIGWIYTSLKSPKCWRNSQ